MSENITNLESADENERLSSDFENNKNQISSQVSDDVSSILNYLQSFSFIEISDDGLYINPDNIQTRQDFINFVQHVFNNNFYFENLDYVLFQELMFDFVKKKWQKYKLCQQIKTISPERIKKYSNPMNFKNSQAEYTFSPVYDDVEQDWKTIEVQTKLNIDEFIARMWCFGIKYWLKILDIQEAILSSKNQKIIIAETQPPLEWIDARILALLNLWKDHEMMMKTWGMIDLKLYKRVFPQVRENTKLYQKIESIAWDHGMDIWGNIIPEIPPKDINLKEISAEWVHIVQEGGIDFIVSTVSGYVTPLQWDYHSKDYNETENNLVQLTSEQIKWQVKVTKNVQLSIIWPETGSVKALGDIYALWVLGWYEVEWINVETKWDVYGNISAMGDISITGNVTWGEHRQSQWVGVKLMKDGQVISEKGNIQVVGNALSRSRLQALNGKLEVNNAEAAILIGKDIVVKNVRNSIIIGENILVEWMLVDCLVICTKKFIAKQTLIHHNQENIIFYIKPEDYEWAFQKISQILNQTNERSQKLTQLLDVLTKENQEIQQDKRILILSNIIKKSRQKESLTSQEATLLSQFLEWYNSKILKYEENRKKIIHAHELARKLQEELEKLTKDFNKLSVLKQEQINPEIEIGYNKWMLKILALQLEVYKTIWEFEKEDIEKLIHLKQLFSQQNLSYEQMLNTTESKVHYKMKS